MTNLIKTPNNEVQETLKVLEKVGVTQVDFKRIRSNPELAKAIAKLIRGFEPVSKDLTSLNPQWLRAREIMGNNFFGIEEAIKHFGVKPTEKELAVLAEIPFTKEVLQECKDTHILVAVFPLSILDIRNKVERKLFYSQEYSWYNEEMFVKNRGEIGWQLVCKTPVKDSMDKNWKKQQALLDKNDETPSAQVMVYTIIGYYLLTGERLFKNVYVRCSCMHSDGSRVHVGVFDSRGLDVSYYWDAGRHSGLGLSFARSPR